MMNNKLGAFLKEEREKRGFTLQEVGLSLKVSLKILQGIESGDNSNLPAKAFVKGFVKSYAQYLKLDVNHVLELFNQQYGEPEKTIEPAPQNIETKITAEASSKNSPTAKVSKKPESKRIEEASSFNWGPAVILASLGLLIVIAWSIVSNYESQSSIETTVVSAEENPEPTSNSDLTTTTGLNTENGSDTSALLALNPTTTIPLNDSSKNPNLITSAPTTLAPTTTLPAPTTTALKTLVPTTVPTTKVNVTTSSTTSSSTTTTKPKTSIEVILEAKTASQFKYSIDGMPSKPLSLAADEVHTFRGKESVELDLEDAGAYNVIVNGRSRGAPGASGTPLKVKYP